MTRILCRSFAISALCAWLAGGCATSSRPSTSGQHSPSPSANTKKAGLPETARSQPEEVPVEALAHYAAGLAYDLDGQPDLALNEYSESARFDPTHEPVVVEAARRYIRNRQPDKAIEILSKATASASASGALHAWLGLAYGQAGQKELAIRANRVAIKKLPRSLPAYQNLAQIYLQNKQTNEALRVLNEAARQPAVEAAFLVDLAELYARYARTQSTNGDAIKLSAVQALDRAAKLNPANPAIRQKLGDGYFELSEFDKAEEVYLQLVQAYPQMSFLRAKLADVYLRASKRDQAMEQLRAIARDEPTNPRTQAFLGALSLDAHKVEEAVQFFERALVLSPEMEQVYYDLAGARIIHQKKGEEGLALLKRARAKFKPSFVMEFYTGLAHAVLKKYGEAVQSFRAAEQVAKTAEPGRLNHHFYYQLGSAYERNDDLETAEKYFQKCLELAPDFADAMNYMGYMWAERGVHLEKARDLIERAVELEPNNAAFIDSLGWVLFKLNQPKQALTWLLQAIEKSDEPDPTLYDHLGDIYATLHEYRRAREAWRKSLNVEPNEASDKIKKKLEAAPH